MKREYEAKRTIVDIIIVKHIIRMEYNVADHIFVKQIIILEFIIVKHDIIVEYIIIVECIIVELIIFVEYIILEHIIIVEYIIVEYIIVWLLSVWSIISFGEYYHGTWGVNYQCEVYYHCEVLTTFSFRGLIQFSFLMNLISRAIFSVNCYLRV